MALPPSFEKDAIRPNVGGRFADMLLASTKHPGMIVYLDNWLSVEVFENGHQLTSELKGVDAKGGFHHLWTATDGSSGTLTSVVY